MPDYDLYDWSDIVTLHDAHVYAAYAALHDAHVVLFDEQWCPF